MECWKIYLVENSTIAKEIILKLMAFKFITIVPDLIVLRNFEDISTGDMLPIELVIE